jgi:hypothetical protein
MEDLSIRSNLIYCTNSYLSIRAVYFLLNHVGQSVNFLYVVLLKILLSLGFLTFSALVLSLISRINSLARQASRLIGAVHSTTEAEKTLAAEFAAAESKTQSQ